MNKVYSRRLSISNQLEDIEALQVSKPCHSHSFPSIIYIPYHSYKKDFTETYKHQKLLTCQFLKSLVNGHIISLNSLQVIDKHHYHLPTSRWRGW